jgi:hypothetical protein
MARSGNYTDGNLFVETWIGDETNDISQATTGDTGVFHVIEVEQGSTYSTLDVRVVGLLPNGINRLAFKPASSQEPTWSKTLSNLIASSPDRVKCEVEVIKGSGSERVQCSKVEYNDQWNPTVFQCTQNIPLEVVVNVT